MGPVEVDTSDRYRFVEERLDEGEEVYVLGTARRDPSAVPEASSATTLIDRDFHGWKDRLVDNPFVISDTGEHKAQRRQLKRGVRIFLLGTVFTGIAIGLFVFVLSGCSGLQSLTGTASACG